MSDPVSPATTARPSIVESFALIACGVILPLVTLGVELTTGMNAEVFFDPLPTALHVLLVALVPFANLAALASLRFGSTAHLGKLALANGCAIGVALFYAVLFLPIMPLALAGVMWFGLGLLPLAPLIALIVAIRLGWLLAHAALAVQTRARPWRGLALGIAALLALELQVTVTRIGMQMATWGSPETRLQGVRLLRAVGSNDVLLRLCYVRSGVATDMVGFLFHMVHRVDPEDARKVYYQVTGTPFNAAPAPVTLRARGRFFGTGEFDLEQGGEAVGGKLRGLSLASSRLDGSLDADAALGYVEWTLVLRNEAPREREARAQIALPPGAVVSRLTLWIDGEERDAAFGGRAKVRQAYESVVRRNRDPALVTTAGSGRVALQLFPVPAKGEMKVRVGMTLPLALQSPREGLLGLPYFHERNFELAPGLRHAVWIESKSPLRGELARSTRAAQAHGLRADLEDERLGLPASAIVAERGGTLTAWAPDGRSSGDVVRQVLSARRVAVPKRLVVVVDGSLAMREAAARVAQLISRVPPGIPTELLVADDEVIDTTADASSSAALARRIERFDYRGGHDNVAALARGLDRASAEEGGALLWIHGPQPVLLMTAEALLQRLERLAEPPAWYELQVQPGVNLIGEKLDGAAALVSLREPDLRRLIASWRRGGTQWIAERERVKADRAGTLRARDKTSDHLARLWASDEVALMLRERRSRDEAIALARRYQLVTPVSGAVVLENRQQYDAAGLEPVAPGTVPTVPEPETWALIAAVLAALAYAYRRRLLEPGAAAA